MKIDLPSNEWASLRDPEQIPRKSAKAFRRALFDLAAPLAGQTTDPEEAAAAAQKAMLASGEAMSNFEGLAEAMVLAVVEEWSYGPVDQETIDLIPDAAFRVLDKELNDRGYFEKLSPDFNFSPEPDSPTKPSAP